MDNVQCTDGHCTMYRWTMDSCTMDSCTMDSCTMDSCPMDNCTLYMLADYPLLIWYIGRQIEIASRIIYIQRFIIDR